MKKFQMSILRLNFFDQEIETFEVDFVADNNPMWDFDQESMARGPREQKVSIGTLFNLQIGLSQFCFAYALCGMQMGVSDSAMISNCNDRTKKQMITTHIIDNLFR